MAVVRISKGKFAPEQHDAVSRHLSQSEGSLRDAIEALDGLLHYYVGIDSEQGYVTNVSVWTTLEAAHQMDSLQAMLDQRPLFEQLGVAFEPITNYETLWTIQPEQ
jgi:hypothetical protein